jgi:two-component system, OmpR family, sensor histidine kinase VicK
VPELIYSSAKSIIEQNRYAFDTLWSRAVVVQDRIKEIERGKIRRKTKTLKNQDEILQETEALARRSKRYTICSSSNGLLNAYTHSLDVFKEILNRHLHNTHAGIRWITKVDDNDQDSRLFEAIRTFTKLGVEIRHVKNIPPMSLNVRQRDEYHY